jgi:hypothetical protein
MAVLVAGMLFLHQVAGFVDGPLGGPAALPTPEMAPEPQNDLEEAPGPAQSPYEYLYAVYPRLARRLDCVIQHESRWTADEVNPRSGASGLAQFLRSTWLSTPQGKAGQSVFDPYANIDGAAWLAINVGWSQWTVVTFGYC